MQTTNKVRLEDLIYYFQNKPDTYQYFTGKLKERMANGEPLEIIMEGSFTYHPENLKSFENFVLKEIENKNIEIKE